MQDVPVSFLADLLTSQNADMSPAEVQAEVAIALQAAGYATDASSVTSPDAVAILEWLDAGIIKSAPEQRAALAGGFRHRNRVVRFDTSERHV